MQPNESDSLTTAQAALEAAEHSYHQNPTEANWKAVEKARATVAQIETRQRIDAELETKRAADARAAARAKKQARLNEILTRLATQNERTDELARRIATAILAAKDLVLVEEPKMVDESHNLVAEANDLKQELGVDCAIPRPLSPYCCEVPSCEAVQRAMPDGVSPYILSSYAGKWW